MGVITLLALARRRELVLRFYSGWAWIILASFITGRFRDYHGMHSSCLEPYPPSFPVTNNPIISSFSPSPCWMASRCPAHGSLPASEVTLLIPVCGKLPRSSFSCCGLGSYCRDCVGTYLRHHHHMHVWGRRHGSVTQLHKSREARNF